MQGQNGSDDGVQIAISKEGHKIPIFCVGIKNTAGQEIPDEPHR